MKQERIELFEGLYVRPQQITVDGMMDIFHPDGRWSGYRIKPTDLACFSSYHAARVQLLAKALRFALDVKGGTDALAAIHAAAQEVLAEAGLDKEPA